VISDLGVAHAETRAVEIDVLAVVSLKTSTDLKLAGYAPAQRPCEGSVMRLKIFSNVLLPAPLRPMISRASPRSPRS
jgi:hypothetical protein